MWKTLVMWLSFALYLSVVVACGSDEEEAAPTGAADVAQEDTNTGSVLGLDDVEQENPCEGIQSQPAAQTEPYHEECAGIEECTQMTPESEGSCFCAICGQKAGQSKCLQVQCPQ